MKDPRDIIIRPVVTEQAMAESANKKYTFEVDRRANKIEIANAIEEIFDVDVEKVNTMNVKGKTVRRGLTKGRTKNWKKAVVSLTEDSKEIDIYAS